MRTYRFTRIFAAAALAAIFFFTPLCEAGKVNINTASRRRLERLPGIGKDLAELIVRRRREVGLFESVAQLGEIYGIGAKRLRALEGEATVGALADESL